MGEPTWAGADCSLRACPTAMAWVSSSIVGSNDMHPTVECSNKGTCDRLTGTCTCFPGYDGLACQRSTCPMDCNGRGSCFPERILASKASRTYETPWMPTRHWVASATQDTVDPRVRCKSAPQALMSSAALATKLAETALAVASATTLPARATASQA